MICIHIYIHRVVPNLKVVIFHDFPHSCVRLRVNHGQLIAISCGEAKVRESNTYHLGMFLWWWIGDGINGNESHIHGDIMGIYVKNCENIMACVMIFGTGI